MTRQAFEHAAALAAAVPLRRLACTEGLDAIPETVTLLERLDADGPVGPTGSVSTGTD